MRFFGCRNDYTALPDQEELASLPFALSGHIDKRSLTLLGWRWRKRAVILNPSGHLIIYKYFLEGVGAGKPFMGRIIHVDTAIYVRSKVVEDIAYLKIVDRNNRKVELRIKGDKAPIWAGRIFACQKGAEIDWPYERCPLRQIDSMVSKSSVIPSATSPVGTKNQDLQDATSVTDISADYTSSEASLHSMQEMAHLSTARKAFSDTDTATAQRRSNLTLATVSTALCLSISDSKLTYFTSDGEEANEERDLPDRNESKTEKGSSIKPAHSVTDIASSVISSSKTATRSLSSGDVHLIPSSRRTRFRRQLQGLIESRLYDSFTNCSMLTDYSVATIRGLNKHAGNLRISNFTVPDAHLARRSDGPAQPVGQQPPICGPSLPLSISQKNVMHTYSETSDSRTQQITHL